MATAPATSVSTDPSLDQDGITAYSLIYAKIKEGDSAADNKEPQTAIDIYRSALQDLERLKSSKPEFQPFIVEYRLRDLARKTKAQEEALNAKK
ncbi:MAG: hypothetical protein HC904_12125 [Blastochloris sp.]|nr:hypothetical protein [Blastochloris sp.]